jgi:hypothetical protein
MFKKNVYFITVPVFFFLGLIAIMTFTACNGMTLTSTSPGRSTSGEIFTIYGRNMGSSQGRKIPSINRCRAYHLEVLSWSSTEVRVRIPPGLPAGNFKVLIYYDDSHRTGSNSLDFWVTAASVSAAVTDPYTVQLRSFRTRYGKDARWEDWMIMNRARYESAFLGAKAAPCTLLIAFRYDTDPIGYSPAWTSEAQHMEALARLAELAYPGYDFRFIFNGDTTTSYANVIAGIPTNSSHASGNNVYLYYEAIFDHEFAHVMQIPHHYETAEEAGAGRHMPPGESMCLMDRNSDQFCSACRTALNIPLDVDNSTAIDAAVSEIARRYPY